MDKPISTPTSSLLQDAYLDRAELSLQLGKSTRTLNRWHTMRIGPPRVVIGRMILYRRQSVLDWLASREEPSAAQRRKGRQGRSVRPER
jgi:predicted DNA-binding transcriptional regulator AlpA